MHLHRSPVCPQEGPETPPALVHTQRAMGSPPNQHYLFVASFTHCDLQQGGNEADAAVPHAAVLAVGLLRNGDVRTTTWSLSNRAATPLLAPQQLIHCQPLGEDARINSRLQSVRVVSTGHTVLAVATFPQNGGVRGCKDNHCSAHTRMTRAQRGQERKQKRGRGQSPQEPLPAVATHQALAH